MLSTYKREIDRLKTENREVRARGSVAERGAFFYFTIYSLGLLFFLCRLLSFVVCGRLGRGRKEEREKKKNLLVSLSLFLLFLILDDVIII